ncbi:hypothetical protein CWI36_0237p0020 [Hamiltosporidium magnivora]|uniref:Sm domain-containing protein n=1 Tax=Hamiltosporidium magnivora TaxID=148818 RepID=A0A4Q9LK69_9MICR|nr:hypothetical protein CWI36_0237p0020 [Hamiltosporidium magnivora]
MKRIDLRNPNKNVQKKNQTLMKLLDEQPNLFSISPVHVLVISLIFIGTVFLLHLYARFGGKSGGMQLFISFCVFGNSEAKCMCVFYDVKVYFRKFGGKIIKEFEKDFKEIAETDIFEKIVDKINASNSALFDIGDYINDFSIFKFNSENITYGRFFEIMEKKKQKEVNIYKFTNFLSHAFTNSFDKKMATYIFLQFLNDKELKTYNLSKNIGENKYFLKSKAFVFTPLKIGGIPLQAIYYFLTNSIKVQIYEKERPKVFYNGIIIGFDEYMNVVLDSEDGKRMLIKGDVICAIVPEKGQDSIINENEIEATEK